MPSPTIRFFINRPIVEIVHEGRTRARLCRPSELVKALMAGEEAPS